VAGRTTDETLREFLAESEELLDALHRNLGVIEHAPDSINPETLNALFRAAHTLKGMSGVMGLAAVSDLAHSLEDVMDRLRMDKLAMSRALLDLLADGVEGLGRLIASASGDQLPTDTGALVERIRNAMNAPHTAVSAVLPAESIRDREGPHGIRTPPSSGNPEGRALPVRGESPLPF
jgi:two-component system chemotaxis sensor kinase CheA